MFIDQVLLDGLRALHLVFFAAGMGTALYHDFLTLRSFHGVISQSDIHDIEVLHRWIIVAFGGLWLTGVTLIYIRTSFDLAQFSPKLWVKVGIMLAMTLNSVLISVCVLPILKRNIGATMCSLPWRQLFTMTQLAAVSMFCWTSGMVLGSSHYLKTAGWEVLSPLVLGWFALVTIATTVAVTLLRERGAARVELPTSPEGS